MAIVHTATNPAHSNQPRGFSLQSLILFITVAAVALGMYSIAPGVGIPLGIILLLVWARTAAVVHRRESTGGAVEPGEKLRLFLVSFGVSIALCILLFVSGCAAFFFACLATVNYNTSDFSAVWGALIVTVVVWLLFAGRIVWRRWQQDTNDGT